MINRKNRIYKNYKRHGYQQNDKNRLDNFRLECQKAVEDAKITYMTSFQVINWIVIKQMGKHIGKSSIKY